MKYYMFLPSHSIQDAESYWMQNVYVNSTFKCSEHVPPIKRLPSEQ